MKNQSTIKIVIIILTSALTLLSCTQPATETDETTFEEAFKKAYPKGKAGEAGKTAPTITPEGNLTYRIDVLRDAVGTPTLPTIDASTGEVTVSAQTTAGTYEVSVTVENGETYTAPFYVTIFAANKQEIAAELEGAGKGIAVWGKEGDYNYIDTSAVSDMSYLLSQSYTLEGVIEESSRTSLFYFNGDISQWDVSKVTNMRAIFNVADSFTGDLSQWDVGQVTDMKDMFTYAKAFNSDISSWKVNNVTNVQSMFVGANAFNQDISSWNVSKVNDMGFMFHGATAFNQDISSWEVEKVTNMNWMFQGASAFNQDISSWKVENVTTMIEMFKDATSFNQNLSEWGQYLQGREVTMTDMFTNSGVTNTPSWYTE